MLFRSILDSGDADLGPTLKFDNTGLTGQYGSNGMYFWGGAASTIFWIDPEEELVAVAMTQVLANTWPLRETFSALVYQSIDD